MQATAEDKRPVRASAAGNCARSSAQGNRQEAGGPSFKDEREGKDHVPSTIVQTLHYVRCAIVMLDAAPNSEGAITGASNLLGSSGSG
jgi:hypothetical protein